MNLLPPLLPFIIPNMGLSISSVGWLMTFFAVTSSVSQLAFGYLTDRIGGRFLIFLGPLVAAVFASSIGIIHSYAALAAALAIAGLGVAAFHPPASVLVGSVSKDVSGRAMSLFSLGGNIGWSLMPLLAVPLVMHFGLSATPILLIPGLVVSLLLYFFAPQLNTGRPNTSSLFIKTVRSQLRPSVCLLGSVAFRSLAFFGLVTFLPKFLSDHGFSPYEAGIMLSLLTFSGAIGGLAGGLLSDNLGRKPIIVGSLFLSVPFLIAFLASDGWIMKPLVSLGGGLLLASFSITVVAAQEIFPDNKAIASSLALGFGLGLGGLGVGLLGNLASIIGLDQTIVLICLLPLLAAIMATGLPGSARERSSDSIRQSSDRMGVRADLND